MADIERTIAVIFKGTDQLSGTINSLAGGLDKFSGNVVNVTQPLSDMAAQIVKIESALAALAIGGLAVAVTAAGKFSSAFGEIATLIDVPREGLQEFEQSILNYARTSTASIEDINKATYGAISAGIDWKDSISSFIPVAEKLATAGLAPLGETTLALATTLNAYGLGVEQAEHVSDLFFTTVKLGVTTIPDLVGSLGQVSAVAAQAGVPLETMLAGLAAITKVMPDTALAVTGLKAVISTIINPTKETADYAKELGIQFNAAGLQSIGLEGILRQVGEATGGSAEKMAILFPNVRAYNAAAILATDASGAFASSLIAMKDSSGATAEALEKVAQDFDRVNQTLINNLRVTVIEVGKPLLDEYVAIANQISTVFQGVSVGISSDAFKPVYDLLEKFGVDVAKYLGDVGKVLNDPQFWENIDFSPLIQSIQNLGGSLEGAFQALFGNVDLTTAEGLADAIDKVQAGISILTNVTAGIVEAWTPFLKKGGEMIDFFLQADEETQKTIGHFIGFGDAINFVFGHVGGLTTALEVLAYSLSAGSLFKSITGIVSLIGGGATVVAGTLTGALGAALLAVGAFFGELERRESGQTYGDVFKDITDSVGFIPEFIGNLKDAASEVWNVAKNSEYWRDKQYDVNAELDVARMKQAALSNEIDATPESKTFTLLPVGTTETIFALTEMGKEIEALPDQKTIGVKGEAEAGSGTKAAQLIVTEVTNASGELVTVVKANPDYASIEKTKAEIATIPTEKLLEIKLQGEIDTQIAKIKADAETIQTLVEWKAKLDIAEAEASAKKFEAAAQSISDMFTNTGDVLVNLFDTYGSSSGLKSLNIEGWIKEESLRRDKLLTLETSLVEAEIKLMESKAKAVDRGESLITITGDGLEPELEAFMMAILKKIQIRATEDNATYLLGL